MDTVHGHYSQEVSKPVRPEKKKKKKKKTPGIWGVIAWYQSLGIRIHRTRWAWVYIMHAVYIIMVCYLIVIAGIIYMVDFIWNTRVRNITLGVRKKKQTNKQTEHDEMY